VERERLKRLMNKIILITFIFLMQNILFAEETIKEKKIAKYVMENIQKDYLDCYSFYKVAAVSFKKAGKEKDIIESLEKSADVSLKYNYDLGEIMGLNPEVMAEMTKDKVNNFVELANKDFSSLAKKYGLVCKNLVENPKERTNYWEKKGSKLIK
tara:strand:+ start:21 stop:485 length:465 start_codon:yes stop_codon:yes gene_type:complete